MTMDTETTHPHPRPRQVGPAANLHRAKIAEAVKALVAAGALQSWHKDVEVRRKATAWLRAHGAKEADLPSLATWKRNLPRLRVLWSTGRVTRNEPK
jgi:hypothetical protein